MNPESLDELISAVLDGEATEAEVARVQADPALSARLDELTSVRSRLQGEAVPVAPEGAVDAAVAAALAATVPVAPVVTHSRWRRAAPVLAVAAAAFVVVFGIAALTRSSSDQPKTTTAAGAMSDSATAKSQAASEAPSAANAFGTASLTAQLGSYTDRHALVDAARHSVLTADLAQQNKTADAEDGTVSTTTAGAATPSAPDDRAPCLAPTRTDALALDTSAELDGAPVRVFVYDVPPGLAVVVVDAVNCTTLFTDGP